MYVKYIFDYSPDRVKDIFRISLDNFLIGEFKVQLTLHTDYSLRVLVYLAQKGDQQATISEIADYYQISRNHLVKVVHHLASAGFIRTTRGKYGGMVLARAPELISIGEVVQKMEPNFDIVECFNNQHPACNISPICKLKSVLYMAGREFLAVLDKYSLADAINADTATGKQIFPVSWVGKSSPGKASKIFPTSD